MRTLCLGEAIVDLVCERPVRDLSEADAFVPHFGGATANVAVTAARMGAEVELAGGAGDDPFGHWLERGLRSAGVGLRWFELVGGADTPVAFAAVDTDGEPRFRIYGNGIAATLRAVGDRLDEAVAACDALFLSSNTLAGVDERDVTLRARERALALERPVVFDPNLRLHRWPSAAEAASVAQECVPGAFLVRCNRTEAELLTGESNAEAAANALHAAGARHVVVTLGGQGALLRGELHADVAGRPARVISTIGAGDTLMGVLLARLSLAAFYEPAIAAALPEAVEQAARATERWGAVA